MNIIMPLIFIIVLVLPTVRGCCFPKSFSAEVHGVEDNVTERIMIDFSLGKIFFNKINGATSVSKSTFGDLRMGRAYNFENGKCTIDSLPTHLQLKRCISPNATSTSITLNLGENAPETAAAWKDPDAGYTIIISKIQNQCMPLVKIDEDENGKTQTHLFSDINSRMNLKALFKATATSLRSCVQNPVVG